MKKIICISIIITNLFMACKSNSDPSSDNDIIKSWKIVGDVKIYGIKKISEFSFTVSDNNVPYIAYYEEESIGNYRGIVKKFNGNSSIWENVGNGNFSENKAVSDISIKISKSDIPYITYIDLNSKVYITTLKDNNWTALSDESDFNNSKSVSLSLSSSDMPYIAYEKDNSILFGRYFNNKWEPLEKISDSRPQAPHLNLSSDNTPYIAYVNYDNNTNSISVKKYANLKWEAIGAEKFAEVFYSSKPYLSLALATHNNIPYVAYSDKNNGYKATVMKYEEGSWKPVGMKGFSKSSADDISLKISKNGTLYASYIEKINSYNIAVMKFDGNDWQSVSQEGFTKGEVYYSSLDLSKTGVPYVAYYDDIEQKIIVMKFE